MSQIQPYGASEPSQHVTAVPPAWPDTSGWPAPWVPYVTDQRPIDSAVVIVAWVLTALTSGYLLPWAVAATRGKADTGSIALINVLLGWTVIGWIAAVVLACMPHRVVGPAPGVQVVWPPIAGWYAAPDGYDRQWWDGTAWTDHRAP